MSNYQERFMILIFTILSTIFILGCFISSSSYNKLTATPPTVRGQYFLTSTQRTEFEKSQILNELPPKKSSNVSEKTWKILWYNIPSYLVPYLRNSRKKKMFKNFFNLYNIYRYKIPEHERRCYLLAHSNA